MLPTPWDWILTACFVATGIFCLGFWIARGDHGRDPSSGPLVDANHALMSVSMIAMIWLPFGQIGSWVQAGAFALLGAGLAALSVRATPAVHGVDGLSHVLLNAAMVWMLLAMPLLMGTGPSASGGGHHQHHGGGTEAAHQVSATPGWVSATNTVAIAISAAVALWWAVRAVRGHHRLHALCHLLMGAGMAAMLALM